MIIGWQGESAAGAAKGERVHWLLWELRPDFKQAYECVYDYAFHRYIFYRMEGRWLYDVFIVFRTCRKCFRVMYGNLVTREIEYFSAPKPRLAALRMWLRYQKTDRKCVDGVEE